MKDQLTQPWRTIAPKDLLLFDLHREHSADDGGAAALRL